MSGLSYELARSMRAVLLGTDPPATLTRRAAGALTGLRSDAVGRVHASATVVSVTDDDLRWWTWAGYRANATLAATLAKAGLADPAQRVSPLFIRLRSDLRAADWPSAVRPLGGRLVLPDVDDKAVAGLKFSAALPPHLAVATLAARLAGFEHAADVLAAPVRFESSSGSRWPSEWGLGPNGSPGCRCIG